MKRAQNIIISFIVISASLLPVSAPSGVQAAASFPAAGSQKILNLPVPFTSQAPLGEWRDERQQDGCEEASAAMAMAFVGGEKNISRADWRLRILILSTFENKKYGEYRDVALHDIVAWLFQDYFHYQKAAVRSVAKAADIISELEKGNIVLTPMNGRKLKNPHYSAPGPERHMVLVKGYDYASKEFITNDPGTRYGESYRYPEKIFFDAIRDYKTGNKLPFGPLEKNMIVISK